MQNAKERNKYDEKYAYSQKQPCCNCLGIFALLRDFNPRRTCRDIFFKGGLKGYELPEGFSTELSANAFENTADVRIMSSNILVDYESWGGTPAKLRGKQYIEVLKTYKPDVVGIQEMSDEWFDIICNNLPDGYKMLFPVSTGIFTNMTAMIYNSNTLKLIDSGNFKYNQGDDSRTRRVVWGVFETENGKRFAATSTHLDLIREGREEEETEIMKSQANQLIDFANGTNEKYGCPVICVGDYNCMEERENNILIDIPEIYNLLASQLTDAKYSSKNTVKGVMTMANYPDHIFIKGNASAETFAFLSYKCLENMSDHYPIFADINIK